MNQNNLDKLFQEKLTNLEVTPSESVWGNLESKLKKKKRKVVPFWWFASGIAAMLVLGMLLFPFFGDQNNAIKTDSDVIITESTTNKIEIIYKTKIDTVTPDERKKEDLFIVDKKPNLKPQTEQENFSGTKKKLVSTKNAIRNKILAYNSINKTIKSTKINEEGTILEDKKKDKEEKKKVFLDTKKEKNTSTIQKVELDNLRKKKESDLSTKKIKNKWTVAPVFAVLNSNSFSKSSPVNKDLSNTTKGKSSFSYGFQVGYKINKKWSIQSGIHIQETGFENNQITAVPSISSGASSISFSRGNSFSFDGAPIESSDLASSSLLKTNSLNGDLNQNYGYIEIPIEVKYNFISANNFNTKLVAGFSSLFLNKNEVNLSTQFVTEFGKASNLNKINFSGNLGLDFSYSLTKNWSLNVNPMFKAQLNTFSEKSNGFSPFNLGIYSGIEYTF